MRSQPVGEVWRDGIKNLLENNVKNNIKSKNEIWRRITRPGLFGKLEISNSPNRYPGIDIIVSI